jgi:hypothetical protein
MLFSPEFNTIEDVREDFSALTFCSLVDESVAG